MLRLMPNYSCEKAQWKICIYLWWFHIENLCNTSLHYEEMGIVYIKLNWAKQILYSVVLDIRAIDEVLVLASCYNLKIITNIKIFSHNPSYTFSSFLQFVLFVVFTDKEKVYTSTQKTLGLRSSFFWDVTKHTMVVLLGLLDPWSWNQ